MNKCDLGVKQADYYRAHFSEVVLLSAREGAGMAEMESTVERLFTDGRLDLRQDAVLTNARQHAAVIASAEALKNAVAALQAGYPIDLCCTDAERAMSSLCEVDGRAVSEDIVSQIFSHFCVGK